MGVRAKNVLPKSYLHVMMKEQLFDCGQLGRDAIDLEFRSCNLAPVTSRTFTVAGLFAGIGGIELGLGRSGGFSEILCENWEPAKAVLQERFPGVQIAGDVRDVPALPSVDLVTAGFPCTDLSQAGRTSGIDGRESGLVNEVFRLLDGAPRRPMVMFENVRNMLALDSGRAMRHLVDELEALGYRWAYRLVDSRFTGVPQRRQRVIFLASQDLDPRAVLFADDDGEPDQSLLDPSCFGFYWTEGVRGLGWAKDAVPTLKGGSTIGIPSPPAIWNPKGALGHRVLLPIIEEAEQLQGFPAGWTEPANVVSLGKGTRWKLVGNAVTVGVSTWIGRRLMDPGEPILSGRPVNNGDRWPTAAYGARGRVWGVNISMWPTSASYRHLREIVDLQTAPVLSARATAGFLSRARRGNLSFVDGFLDGISEHAALVTAEDAVA